MPELKVGQKRNVNPDDFVTAVESIVFDMLVYYRHYTGKVMAIDKDMIAKLYVEELNAKEDDKNTWIPARPATIVQSFIPVKVGQYVEFYFKEGNASNARWIGLDPLTYTSKNGNLNKYVIFESGTFSIIYDSTTSKFEIKNGTSAVEKTVLGETLKEILSDLIDAIKALTVNSPVGVTSTPINNPQFTLIANRLDDILSENNTNN